MEWLTRLQDQVVGLDTAPLIYFIEQNEAYLEKVRAFFQAMNQGEFQVVTSTLTLTEVLVHPLRSGNVALAEQYRDIVLEQENLITVPVSVEISEIAAQLRATAMQRGASFFLTNDARLAVSQI
jgi:predicted nucleic acid-binding protein